MSKKGLKIRVNLILGGFLLLISIGGYVSWSNASDLSKKDTFPTNKIEYMTNTGSYEVYTPEKLVKAVSGKVVLFFRANWCSTCTTLDADIKTNRGDIPPNLSILYVDYDNSSDLKKKYSVTVQHTLVQVDKDGKLVKKWVGSPTLATLLDEIK